MKDNVLVCRLCCDSTKLWAGDLCQATVSPRTSSAWMLVWGRRSKAALVSLVRVHNLQHLIWRLLVTVRVQNNNRQHLLSTYIVIIGMNIFIKQYVLVPVYGAIHYLNLIFLHHAGNDRMSKELPVLSILNKMPQYLFLKCVAIINIRKQDEVLTGVQNTASLLKPIFISSFNLPSLCAPEDRADDSLFCSYFLVNC